MALLLYDNAQAHASAIATTVFQKEMLIVLNCIGRHSRYDALYCRVTTPSLYTRPCPYDFILFFPKLKTFLSGWRYRSRQALGSAVYQCLTSIPKSAYGEWRIPEVDSSTEIMHSQSSDLLWGHGIKKFAITCILNVPGQNKQFFSTGDNM